MTSNSSLGEFHLFLKFLKFKFKFWIFQRPLNQKLDLKKREMFDDDLEIGEEEDEVDEDDATTPKNIPTATKTEVFSTKN